MFDRCHKPNHKDYPNYGGRGIRVCFRWFEFENFYEDMGDPPFRGASIDRINNNGPYEKNNCRWATYSQQAKNRRPRRGVMRINHEGKNLTITEWSKLTGIARKVIEQRLSKGWPGHEAVSRPKGFILFRERMTGRPKSK